MFYKFILSSFLSIIIITKLQSQDETRKEIVLYSDQNVIFTLYFCTKADISQTDWLKLKITNTSHKIIHLTEISYSIDGQIQSENGPPYLDYGIFGSGNKYDLIHYFYDLPNASDYSDNLILEPDSSITAWKYLTNYASVLLEQRNLIQNEICAEFSLSAIYIINNQEKKIKSTENHFCFDWLKSDDVPIERLIHRLREIILHPYYRWVNTYVTSFLMTKAKVVAGITSSEIIEGILQRKNVMNADESILLLSELSSRKSIPNNQITEHFRENLRNNSGLISTELNYYWDNTLLDDLLNSKMELFRVANILELNAKYWCFDALNTQKVFHYFQDKLNFNTTEKLDTNSLIEWSRAVKIISISRNNQFIDYLKPYLDDETEFTIEDWSRYQHMGMLPKGAKPDLINVRICDVALVAILRAFNQFEFTLSRNIGSKFYSVTIKNDFLNQETINQLKRNFISNDINLSLYEREIKLTPTLKQTIRAK